MCLPMVQRFTEIIGAGQASALLEEVCDEQLVSCCLLFGEFPEEVSDFQLDTLSRRCRQCNHNVVWNLQAIMLTIKQVG